MRISCASMHNDWPRLPEDDYDPFWDEDDYWPGQYGGITIEYDHDDYDESDYDDLDDGLDFSYDSLDEY